MNPINPISPSIGSELVTGLTQSRTLRAIVLSAGVALAATALAFATMPATLAAIGALGFAAKVGGSTLASTLIWEAIFHKETFTFEWQRAYFLFKKEKWNKIGEYEIYLGAL